jgi:hypothetical protein
LIHYMKIRTVYIFIAVVCVLAPGIMMMVMTRMETRIDTNKITLPSIDNVSGESWAELAEKRIFFGHQSVGYNIIDGISDVMNERDCIKLNVLESHKPAIFDQPVLAHSQVGRNTDPVSKIESFVDIMDAGAGGKIDVAFFKFCYVDIMRDSDPQKIFDAYSAAIEDLKERYPETRFIHVTVPLRSTPKGLKKNLKQSVKLLIGKPGVLEDNIMRERYNRLLRNAFSKTEPVFDLAMIESINPDGFRCYAAKGTERVSVMVPEYTEDSGHLNDKGRKRVAEQLLIILAGNFYSRVLRHGS